MAWHTALPEAIIPLGIEQSLLVEACLLKLMIHVRSDHELILIFHEVQQAVIDWFWRQNIAVYVDVP